MAVTSVLNGALISSMINRVSLQDRYERLRDFGKPPVLCFFSGNDNGVFIGINMLFVQSVGFADQPRDAVPDDGIADLFAADDADFPAAFRDVDDKIPVRQGIPLPVDALEFSRVFKRIDVSHSKSPFPAVSRKEEKLFFQKRVSQA